MQEKARLFGEVSRQNTHTQTDILPSRVYQQSTKLKAVLITAGSVMRVFHLCPCGSFTDFLIFYTFQKLSKYTLWTWQ